MNGCDKEDAPFVETPAIVTTNPGNAPVRKVLLEKFTGHVCGNCPLATIDAEQLKTFYPDQIIMYTIHAPDCFSEPQESTTNLGTTYPLNFFFYDFRCQTGSEIAFEFAGSEFTLPNGMVNRKGGTGNPLLAKNDWAPAVTNILSTPIDATLELSSTYNSTTRELTAEVNTEFIQAQNGTYNLCVFLVEDSIVNWQLIYDDIPNYPTGDVENYVHRHTLRGSMNNTWGEEIANGSITAGDTIAKTYTTILDTEWNENQMSIVAFVYDFTTKEVLQAEEMHLQH